MRITPAWLIRHPEEVLAGLALAAMALIAFIAVFMRYVVNAPLMWADEINRYLFIWMTYLGAVVATKHKTHIRLEVTDKIFTGRLGTCLKLLLHLLMIGTLAVVVSKGVELVLAMWSIPTALLRIPTGLVYLAVPSCGTVMAGYLVRDVIGLGRQLWRETTGPGRRGVDA